MGKNQFTVAKPREESVQSLIDYLNELEELVEDREMDEDERDQKILKAAKDFPIRWNHILFAYSVLVDNCLDNAKDSLEFAPWIIDMHKLLKEMKECLDTTDSVNYITSNSPIHKQMGEVLAKSKIDNDGE